jgi:hypothetical protein
MSGDRERAIGAGFDGYIEADRHPGVSAQVAEALGRPRGR